MTTKTEIPAPIRVIGYLCPAYELGICYYWSTDEAEVREHYRKGEHRG